jgi:hypothetical protein
MASPPNVHAVTLNESGQVARTLSAAEIAAANADTVVIPADRNTGSRAAVPVNVSGDPSGNRPQISDGETILQEAARITSGDRQRDYGHPADNHQCTAVLWASWLQRRYGIAMPLTAEDVCFLNILQKLSRAANSTTRDSLVDLAGYASNIEQIRNRSGL